MAPHSRITFVKYQRPISRWAMGCIAALLCLSTMLPSGVANAQQLLPVVIKLPPSFLRSAPIAKMDAPLDSGLLKSVGAHGTVSQIAAVRNTEVRATELRGLLPYQFAHHYFGLEATEPGGAFAITLVVEPATVLEDNAVNFVVLTEDGMTKFMSGVDPLAVKTSIGSPLLFDKVGNRLTALVPGSLETNYTVIVFNNGKLPVTYMLQVQGGTLVDDAGQTYSAIKVGSPLMEATEAAIEEVAQETKSFALVEETSVEETSVEETMVKFEGVVKRLGITKPVEMRSMLRQLLPEAVRARQVSGELMSSEERHYLNLATDLGGGETILTLRYESAGGMPTHLNFWVMTQDGVRHLIQGGLAQELNLATGLPVAGEPGTYQVRLRMAENTLYTVVVFSEGMAEADYTLAVQGGILVDRYGQTREAQAAEMEVLALASK